MARRRPEDAVGLGPGSVPYDRTGGSMLNSDQQAQALQYLNQGGAQQGGAPPQAPQGPPPVAQGQPTAPPAQPQGGLLASAGGQPTSDQFSDEELAALGGGGQQQDPQVQAAIAALEDPNTPPDTRQAIQTMLAIAARRRMAGIQA